MYYIWSTSLDLDYPENYWFQYEGLDSYEFTKGVPIENLEIDLTFNNNTKININRLMKFNELMSSNGPIVISDKLANILKENASDDVQIFDCNIFVKNELIKGFKVLNIIKMTDCLDLSKCELEYFIPSKPEKGSMITKHIFKDDSLSECNIARAKGSEISIIVVSEKLKNIFAENGINDIYFCPDNEYKY